MGSANSSQKQNKIQYIQFQNNQQTQYLNDQTEQSTIKVEENYNQVKQKQCDEYQEIDDEKIFPIQEDNQFQQPKQIIQENKINDNKQKEMEILKDINSLNEFIQKYKPKDLEIDYKLKPFIPDYIPALSDVEDCIYIERPDKKLDLVGLTDLRENISTKFVQSAIKAQVSDAQMQFIHDQEELVKKLPLQQIQKPLKQKQQCIYQQNWYMENESMDDLYKRLDKIVKKYIPKNIEIPAILKPFIPDYIPAVRGPCEMILIPRPDDQPDYIGIERVQEFCKQSNYNQEKNDNVQTYDQGYFIIYDYKEYDFVCEYQYYQTSTIQFSESFTNVPQIILISELTDLQAGHTEYIQFIQFKFKPLNCLLNVNSNVFILQDLDGKQQMIIELKLQTNLEFRTLNKLQSYLMKILMQFLDLYHQLVLDSRIGCILKYSMNTKITPEDVTILITDPSDQFTNLKTIGYQVVLASQDILTFLGTVEVTGLYQSLNIEVVQDSWLLLPRYEFQHQYIGNVRLNITDNPIQYEYGQWDDLDTPSAHQQIWFLYNNINTYFQEMKGSHIRLGRTFDPFIIDQNNLQITIEEINYQDITFQFCKYQFQYNWQMCEKQKI